MRTYKPKTCPDCEATFTPRSASHVRCDDCGRAHKVSRVAEANRAYREANRERLVLEDAARYAKNREKMNAQNKAYHQVHAEEIAARRKRNYELKREEILKRERRRYEAEKERIKEVQRAYRARRPSAVTDRLARRRAIKRAARLEPYRPSEIFERDNWTCQLCEVAIDPAVTYPNPMSKSIDHIIPLSGGGMDGPSNVQASHLGCNIRKGARLPEQVA